MVPCLQQVDRFITDPIDEPMFLGNPSGPTAAEDMLQRLGLSDARERIAKDSIDKVQDPQANRSLVLDPEAKILKKLRWKDRDPFTLALHPASLSARPSLPGA